MKSIIIQAWTVHKKDNKYFLPYTHWIYLNEIVKYYSQVCLLSPVKTNTNPEQEGLVSLVSFKNVSVEELPYSSGYISAIPYFFNYILKYRNFKEFDVSYIRYPVPFGWLQKIYLTSSKRIIHFVGDPVDAAKANPNFSWIKRTLLTTFFYPEHKLYLWACKGASVYTNGFHLSERLEKEGIHATSLISSTLNIEDFYLDEKKEINPKNPKFIYVGYLRRAKGVEVILNAFKLFLEDYPEAILSIVGAGDFEKDLKSMVLQKKINNVTFYGHIDKRDTLNELLRSHDIFCFASLSEGSPRVILEAMANGLNVISTPVGSLPKVFSDNEHLLFSDFNNPVMFKNQMENLINQKERAQQMRLSAFRKVQEYTIDNFLRIIFK